MENQDLPEVAAHLPKISDRLKAFLLDQKARLSGEQFEELLKALGEMFQEFTFKLDLVPPGASRARLLHTLTDEALRSAASVQSSCLKGCAACCHYNVEVTSDEAQLLASLVRQGTSIDMDRLRQQASWERTGPEWSRFLNPQNRCVFLSESNECRVYAHRPFSCRKLLVSTPAQNCFTEGAAIQPLGLLEAEVLQSAALHMEGTSFNSLPKMLLAESLA